MNRKTIQKVIDELSQPTPRLDYVRGVLETILDTLPIESIPVTSHTSTVLPDFSPVEASDEAKALEYMAKAKLEAVKQMSQENG